MKVLHYIDEFHPIRLPKEYFEILAREAGEDYEVHLLMPKPDEEVKIEGVHVHYLSYFTWMLWRNKRRFRRVMDEVNPDILNIHSCWSRLMMSIVEWNEKYYKRPLVLSTHKLLMPWHSIAKLKRRLQMKLYQNRIIEQADVILVDTPQETNIQTNKHIVTIPNAVYSANCSEEDMRREYSYIHAALSNSKPYLFMSDEERRKEAMLLREAVMYKQHMGERLKNEDELNDSYRKIILHAQYEGTLNMLLPFLPAGAKEYADNTPHYIYNSKKNLDPLLSLKTLSRKSLIASVGKEEHATEAELKIVKLLVNVRYEIVHNTISQRHLAELYREMKLTDYDEDTVNVMLLRMNIHQDTARLMQLLKDFYMLEEGFMPMEPLDDKVTQTIKDKLLLWQVQA